jgi:hypothetical protein
MKLKFIQYSFAAFVVVLLYLSTASFSTTPPVSAAATGCSCHGASSTNTEILYYFNNGSLSYVNGQTYTLIVEINSYSFKPRAGFVASVNIGTFGTAPAGTTKSGTTTKYWNQNTPAVMTNIGGLTQKTFVIDWTAPATGNTPLVINVSGVAVNLNGGTSGDETAIGTLATNVPLSVVFKTMEASLINNTPTCTWEVKDQTNIKQFQLQASTNGKDFNTLQNILPNASGKYVVTDATNYTSNTIYYRVHAMLQNGTQTVSTIKLVNLNKTQDVSIYPTTLSANKILHISNSKADDVMYIYSLNGALLQTINCNKQTTVDMASYASGMYLVVVKNQQQTVAQQKIIVE